MGLDLLEQVTLVGGSMTAVLPLTIPVRPTRDVDFILPTKAPMDWHRFIYALEGRGFVATRDPNGPACRYEMLQDIGLLVVDIMPTDRRLGFTNPWYPDAHLHRQATAIAGLYCASPIYFLLTKIAAFKDRGAADPLASHDLEDILTVCSGLPGLLDSVLATHDTPHTAARDFLLSLVRRPDALSLLEGHAEGDDASQARARTLHMRLKAALA
jgi:hypothetical protein